MDKKKILLLGTGGTIASQVTTEGLDANLTTEELLRYVPGIAEFSKVESIQVANIDSTNISPTIWMILAKVIKENYDQYDGFVITHGTDTMAYTAAALSYLIQTSPKPIIITGSQKPINMDITDSKTNLYDSFLYASSDKASGVQIIFNGKVMLGTRSRKTHTKSYEAFASINYPLLATIQDGRILSYIPGEKNQEPVFYEKLDASVGLFKLIPGANSEVLSFLLEKNTAVIIESYGVGGIPSLPEWGFYKVIEEWTKKGKTVVMTTQVPNEGSDMEVYRVGQALKNRVTVLEAFDMITEAVVCKLMWILGQTKDPEEITHLFYTPIGNDILYKK